MPRNVLDSGEAVVDKIEMIPVLIKLIVDWCVTCINILTAYVVQRQEILLQDCPNFPLTCDDREFIYDKV